MFQKLKDREVIRAILSHDLMASVVVFLVALPLCLGIAIATGVPPALGLVTAIIGGLIVGPLSGAPLLVSGPAAGLVAVNWEHGLETFGVVVLLAGLIQVIAGVSRLGQWFRAVSPAVIQGMLAGIGVLIMAGQFHVMLDDKPRSSGVENILSIGDTLWKGLFPMDGSSHHIAAALGVVTILILAGWSLAPKKVRIVPGALVAVVVSVLACSLLSLPVNYVAIPSNLLDVLKFPTTNSIGLLASQHVWISALTLAFIASAETILSAAAVDKMHNGPRAKCDKELMAQGVGNALCGFVGALPMTGVIVRSAANVEAGAKTRMSTILHAIWITGLVVLVPHILELIPTASLAAVLVYTGYKLLNLKEAKNLWRVGKSEFVIFAVTLVMVVATNLLEGVIIGVALSLLKLLYVFSRLELRLESRHNGEELHLLMKGSATIISLPKLAAMLEATPLGKNLHVHVENVEYIDHACLELLMSYEQQYNSSGGILSIEWPTLNARMKRKPREQALVL
jgi:MFS superfamily sulfate permease-like transporter